VKADIIITNFFMSRISVKRNNLVLYLLLTPRNPRQLLFMFIILRAMALFSSFGLRMRQIRTLGLSLTRLGGTG